MAAARDGHGRRCRDPGRRLQRHVDGLLPEGARSGHRRRPVGAGHLRRGAERSQRRVRDRVLGFDRRAGPAVRRRRRPRALPRGLPERGRDRPGLSAERPRRLVHLRRGTAGDGRDAGWLRAGSRSRRRRGVLGHPLEAVPPPPCGAGELHRADRAGAGTVGGDQLDRRRGPAGPASVAALRADDARRTDRHGLRGDAAGPSSEDRPAVHLRRAVPSDGCRRLAPDVPDLPRRAPRGRMGRPHRRRRHVPAVLRELPVGHGPSRTGIHRERRRPLPPGRPDPGQPGDARGGRFLPARPREPGAAPLPPRTDPLARDARGERGHPPQGRRRGPGPPAEPVRDVRGPYPQASRLQPGAALRFATYGPPPRRAVRSWWMEEALANDPGEPCPPLAADTAADVVILGGGYTGMWTAYFLKERDPGIDVVLLEQDICGGGPSGRNGGFVTGYWGSIGELARRFGDGDALELCLAASRSVAEIGRFCQRNDIDAWFTFGGELAVASNPFQEGSWGAELDEARRLGAEDEFVELSADEVRKRVDSPVLLGGVFHPDAATVQPARLARGLRRVLLERGVRIYEGTPVRRFGAGPPAMAETPDGSVRAAESVVGVGSWGIHWKRFRRNLAVRGSYIVLTERAPGRADGRHWIGG